MVKLTEKEFDEKYELQINHIVRKQQSIEILDEDICSFNGCLYETYGEELDFVIEMINQNRVITIIEGEDDSCTGECEACECSPSTYYISGYHLVNRLGYLITKEPITEEFEVKLDW